MDQSNPLGALASVLARDISQIEDLPEFVAPPPGIYKLLIESFESKEINEKTYCVCTYVIVENVSLNDQGDQEELAKIKPGSKMSELFSFEKAEKVETVLSVLKAKYGALGAALGTTNLLDIVTKMQGMLVQAQLSQRVDKNDKSKLYAGTKNIVPAV